MSDQSFVAICCMILAAFMAFGFHNVTEEIKKNRK